MKEGKIAIRYITKLSNKVRRKLDTFSPEELSGAEGRTLHFLIANSDLDIFQKDIEEEFGLRPSTASVLLSKMEEHGLVKRIALDEDARYKRIALTDKGLKYKNAVRESLDELEACIEAGIDSEDFETCFKVLEKISSNLE